MRARLTRTFLRGGRVALEGTADGIGVVATEIDVRSGEPTHEFRRRAEDAFRRAVLEADWATTRGARSLAALTALELTLERPAPPTIAQSGPLLTGETGARTAYFVALIDVPGEGQREIVVVAKRGRVSVSLPAGARCLSLIPVSPDGLHGTEVIL